jgi:hypothetical protein
MAHLVSPPNLCDCAATARNLWRRSAGLGPECVCNARRGRRIVQLAQRRRSLIGPKCRRSVLVTPHGSTSWTVLFGVANRYKKGPG